MAELYFTGETRWAKVHKVDEKYQKHSIEIKLDEAGIAAYQAAGIQGRPSKDGMGYYTFRRDPKHLVFQGGTRVAAGKPAILDANGAPFSGSIGNGSVCTIKVTTYNYNNSFGKGVGCRLEAVRVDKLVEYRPDNLGPPPLNQDPSVKVKIPF